MSHIKLFEDWKKPLDLRGIAQEMVRQASQDPVLGDYNLILGASHPDGVFIRWINQRDVPRWQDSGYAEDFGPEDKVPPMNALAIVEKDGAPYAYKLTPEEKYYGSIVSMEDEDEEENDQLVPLHSFTDFKEALLASIWDME